MALPEDLVAQFRGVALQRLDRIEAAWAQILVRFDGAASSSLHREVHTLKGESRILGFIDINLVCHKLEDLLAVARARGYAVDEDFDLIVNMALRFMAMLVRKRVGAQLGGIDLPGFVKQIDQILEEARSDLGGRSRTGSMPPLVRTATPSRVPLAVRDRLGAVAIDAFIEYAAAKEIRRNRLRSSWHAMRELLAIQRAVVGADQLAKHEAGALGLARELGKDLDVVFEPGAAEVTSELLAAIDVAILHLVRNAVDHGIEPPEARIATGKPARGCVTIAARLREEGFVLTVADDGRGIQFDRVRARAVELGLVLPEIAAKLAHDRLVELLLLPGFSTRTEANEISGRGIGLDAVRASVLEVGGTLVARSEEGAGTTWTVTFPVPALEVSGHVVRALDVPFPIVIESAWQLAPAVSAPPIDLARALGLGDGGTGTPVQFERAGTRVAFLCDRAPVAVQARRLIVTPPAALGEIVAIDAVEALLLRPERVKPI